MNIEGKKSHPHERGDSPSNTIIPQTFFPNIEFPGRTLELTVNAVVSGARVKDLAAYLTFLDRAYGRMSPLGLRTYSRRPKEQLKVAQVRPGSLELVFEKILETSSQASPLICLYLFLKYFPIIVKTVSEGYRDYEEGRLTRSKRKELEKKDTSPDQPSARVDSLKSDYRKQIREAVDDITLKEPSLSNVSSEVREEIARLLGEVAQYDRELHQGVERFSVEYVKEIRMRLVPQSDSDPETYHR